MRGLGGKVVVVVAGGTRPDRPSIGGAAACRLGSEGATVVVADIDLDAARHTASLITAAGGTATALHCDVSDEGSVTTLFAAIVATYGGLDGVHSNAMDMSAATIGVDGEHDLTTLPLDVWRRSLDVGLTGFFLVARSAIPLLVARGGGGIVGTASGAVFAGEPIRVGYATAKTGMTAIVRHIATRFGQQGVRANCVAPGRVQAAAEVAEMSAADMKALLRYGRSDRPGTAEDIGAMVTFLLSDDGSWVNGQIINVDGGSILGR